MGSLPPTAIEPKSVRQLVGDVAYQFSDALFHYPLIHQSELTNIYNRKELNLFEKLPIVKNVETRSGAGLVVYGTLESELRTSAILSANTLVEFLPSIITLFHSVSTPLVFHVSSDALIDGQIQSDFIKSLAARNTNFGHLISSSPQETYDFSIIAHLLSQLVKKPIIHIFDGVNIGNIVDTTLSTLNQQLLILLNNHVSKLEANYQEISMAEGAKLVFGIFSKITQREYSSLQYFGSKQPKSIVLLLGSSDATIHSSLFQKNQDLGFVSVKQFNPFPVQLLKEIIPSTFDLKKILVIDQHHSNFNQIGALTSQLLSSLSLSNHFDWIPLVQTVWTKNAYTLDWDQLVNLTQFVNNNKFPIHQNLDLTQKLTESNEINGTKRIQIFNTNESYSPLAQQFIDLAKATGLNVFHQIRHDPTKSVYTSLTDIQLSVSDSKFIHRRPVLTILEDVELLKALNLIQNDQLPNQILILTDLAGDALKDKVPRYLLEALVAGNTSLYTFDLESLINQGEHFGLVSYLAISKLTSYAQLTNTLSKINVDSKKVNDILSKVVKFEVELPLASEEVEEDSIPAFLGYPNYNEDLIISKSRTFDSEHHIIQKFIFPEAFNTNVTHRPDLHDAHLIQVSKFERLTPLDYDRNVFHIEFDTSQTDLTYEIGDALGVYGHNDPQLVEQFLKDYGVDPNTLVTLPGPDGQDDVRTAFHIFAQYLDLFGRPTKKFYQGLSEFAKDESQQQILEKLASPPGAAEFKARVEDTVTYADILDEFTSARPNVSELIRLIPTIKPRHYSISSSQKMHPNSVQLLVVAVEWNNSKGLRFGQCTRYLANLTLGDLVTVSIKPSVMKLPPNHEQPVIMAGLGTGMAPFRAFVEERHYFKNQGIEVGPMALYFGSRSRFSEYLYGAELDQYHLDQLITRLGLAFSRDQPQKIYIQHLMQEDGEMLQSWMLDRNAHFYLCGPTWPEADVREAMVKAFVRGDRMTEKQALHLISEMKEEDKYILELY